MLMRKILVYNILSLKILFAVDISLDESSKVYNAFLMGLNDKAQELSLEIISSEKYIEQRENILYMLSEFYFSEAIKKDSLEIAQRAYTFYGMFLKDYPDSDKSEVVSLRLKFLHTQFKKLQLAGEYLSKTYNTFNEVNKLIDIATFYELSDDYKNNENKNTNNLDQLFIDTKNPFQVADKYYDNIILNYPNFAAYGYYFKIKNYLSQSTRWSSGDWMNAIGQDPALNNFKTTCAIVTLMLKDVREKYPKNEYVLDLHVMYASTIWNTSTQWINKKDKKKITQELLQYVLENDENKTGYRFNIVKEFIIRNF